MKKEVKPKRFSILLLTSLLHNSTSALGLLLHNSSNVFANDIKF